jgi:hypothetical protein
MLPADVADRVFPYAGEGPLGMMLAAYPLLALGDELVAMACIPSRFVVLHVLVAAAGVWGFVWLLRLRRSMRARPHRVEAGAAHLHRGSLASLVVPLGDVESASPVDDDAVAALRRSPRCLRLDVGGRRVLVRLRTPVTARALGRSREVNVVLVSAEDPAALCRALVSTYNSQPIARR